MTLATTIVVGTLGALVSVLLGWPLGLLLRRFVRVSTVGQAALMGPLVMSPVVLAYGWHDLLRPLGVTYGMLAVVLVCGLINAPWVILHVAWSGAHPRLMSLAATLGAGFWQRVLLIRLRMDLRSVGLAATQIFLWCSSSFAVVLALGGGPRVETLEIAMYQKLRTLWDPSGAAILACLQLVLGTGVAFGLSRLRRRAQSTSESQEKCSQLESIAGWGMVAFFWLPFGLGRFGSLTAIAVADGLVPFLRSLCVALGVAICSLGLASLLASRRSANRLWFALSGVSPLAFAVLLIVVSPDVLTHEWGSYAALILAHVVSFGGVIGLVWSESYDARPQRLIAVAASLGARPFSRFLWITWPSMRGAVFGALGLVVAFSFSDVAVAALLDTGDAPLFGAYVMQLAGRYQIDQAVALGAIGSLVPILLLSLGGKKWI